MRPSRRLARRLEGALPLIVAMGLSLAAALLIFHGVAEARPGSGQGFGAPSSGGGSSGGDGDGEAAIFIFLLQIAIEEPAIGVPLIIVFAIVLFVRHRWSKAKDWKSSTGAVQGTYERAGGHAAGAPGGFGAPAPFGAPRGPGGRSALARIAEIDPGFSVVLFEDFVFTLYSRLHEARGGQRLATLAPFLAPGSGQALDSRTPGVQQVQGIIVGAFVVEHVEGLDPASQQVRVGVRFEANYTEIVQGRPQAYWVEERWSLVRSKQARSRAPDKSRTVDCPECGGSIEHQVNFKCRYCSASLAAGVFDWMVESVQLVGRATTGPALTSHAEERGTNEPTRFAQGVQQRMGALAARDPSVTWDAVTRRVGTIFMALQVAWSRREEALLRPLVSDALYHYLRYWLESYRKAGLRNVTEGARILRLELADARTDAWLDAIVIRVHASGLDVTLGDDGRHVSGDRSRERAYTEYWTLIRSVRRQGTPPDDRVCPSCGAPLQVEMAGNCKACRAHVTGGEFDWVLSKIEQDEVYAG